MLSVTALVAVAAAASSPASASSLTNDAQTLKTAAKRSLGTAYGCVVSPTSAKRNYLLVTSARRSGQAGRVVQRLKLKSPASVKVIDRRDSEASILAAFEGVVRRVGSQNPDVNVTGTPSRTTQGCGTVQVQLSETAASWTAAAVEAAQAQYGTKRVIVNRVPAGEIVPPEQRGETQ